MRCLADCGTVTLILHRAAGDKTIFEYIQLGRDRDAIDTDLLVLGVPAIFADLKQRSAVDPRLAHEYKQAIALVIMLMAQEDTALKQLTEHPSYSEFPAYRADVLQLASDLLAHFKEQHPDTEPICSACVKATDQAQVCACSLIRFGDTAYSDYLHSLHILRFPCSKRQYLQHLQASIFASIT